MRAIVGRFFPEFKTTEGLAYVDPKYKYIVFMNRYLEGLRETEGDGSDLTPSQRAALSILFLVFDWQDQNSSNLRWEGDRLVLIDFEPDIKPIDREFVDFALDYEHAPFVQRFTHNDPQIYEDERRRWAANFNTPDFVRSLYAAIEGTGLSHEQAAAFLGTARDNLRHYSENIKYFLDIANGARRSHR